ncbi:MAG: translation elongation factor Ts [Deltaproteobacteria bacterium]|jgi:elongation factor Ts|nr:translation elongation factor Ts [Deltaproteobacteria bacterium]
MAKISVKDIKELRESTGAGMMDCKKALKETEGDMEKAKEFLRKKGLAAAAKKSGRIAAEGTIQSYIHGNGKIGVMVEVNCETDFAAKTPDFTNFVEQLTLHIAATSPLYLEEKEISEKVIQKEKDIHTAQLKDQGKPEKIIGKIVEGKMNKWYSQVCLMNQEFSFNEDGSKDTIEDLAKNLTAKIGEKISVRRFVRWELGEGLEKRVYDIAKDVQDELGN